MKNERQPTEQKVKRLGAKNMELVQTNRRQETRLVEQQEEILSLVRIFVSLFKIKDCSGRRMDTAFSFYFLLIWFCFILFHCLKLGDLIVRSMVQPQWNMFESVFTLIVLRHTFVNLNHFNIPF